MKSGLFPAFSPTDIRCRMANFVSERHKKIINILTYVGEKFINSARNIGSYRDKTGNLRSSIGYIIGLNGRSIKSKLSGNSKGIERAKQISEEILRENPVGFVLIGIAGMSYAAAVESKGYDVITNSVPGASKLLSDFKRILKAA